MPRSKSAPHRRPSRHASRAAMSVLMKDSIDPDTFAGKRIYKSATFRALGSTRGFRRDDTGRVRLALKHKINPRLLKVLENVVFAFNPNDMVDTAEPVRIELDDDCAVLTSSCALPESRLGNLRLMFWAEEVPKKDRAALEAAADALPKTWDQPITPSALVVLDRKLQAVREEQ